MQELIVLQKPSSRATTFTHKHPVIPSEARNPLLTENHFKKWAKRNIKTAR